MKHAVKSLMAMVCIGIFVITAACAKKQIKDEPLAMVDTAPVTAPSQEGIESGECDRITKLMFSRAAHDPGVFEKGIDEPHLHAL